MNNLMNNNTENSVNSFQEKLFELNLSLEEEIGALHSLGSLGSFKAILSKELGISENELMMSIGIFLESDLCTQILKFEIGPHHRILGRGLSILNNEYCPSLAMISGVAQCYKCKVVVLTDDFNLAFLTKGRFLCSVEPESLERAPIIIALVEMGLFRALEGEGRERISDIITSSPADSNFCLFRIQENANVGFDLDLASDNDESDAASSEVRRFSQNRQTTGLMNNESQKIESFIDDNSAIEYGTTVFYDEAYTSSSRIDFLQSDYRCIAENDRVEFQTTIDIDGFFAIIKPEDLKNVFRSGVDIVYPIDCPKKTKEGIIRHMLCIDGNLSDMINAFCFGRLNKSSRCEIIAVLTSDLNSEYDPKEIDLSNFLEKSHNCAMTFPCCRRGCIHSTLHDGVRASRPDSTSQMSNRKYTWEYCQNNFRCLAEEMVRCLNADLENYDGINLSFYIQMIGSKTTCMASDVDNFSSLLSEITSNFDIKTLVKKNESSCLIDVCWKYLPKSCENLDKVY